MLGELDEPLTQRVDLEGLDEVVEDAAAHGLAHRVEVAGGADDDDVELTEGWLAQPAQHVEAAHVGQVDVEQHEVGTSGAHRLEGCPAGVHDANDLEARLSGDDARVHLGHHEVVVDDEHPDHRRHRERVEGECGDEDGAVVVADGDLAATLAADHPHEREADAAPVAGRGLLGADALAEDPLAQVAVDAGSGVAHGDAHLVVVLHDLDGDDGVGGVGGRRRGRCR